METYKGLKKAKIKSERDLILSSEELAPYVRVSYRGEHELGVKSEDKLKIVGIIKEETIEEAEEPLVEPIVPEVPELPEKAEVHLLPSKNYTTKQGIISSQEMAEVLRYGIKHMKNELNTTTDAKKIKVLKDKLRAITLYVAQHDDIKQFMK